MEADTLDVTLSIGTLGDHDVLGNCLRTVFEEDAPALRYEVRVVSNGRDHRAVTEMLKNRFPRAVLICRDGPLGYCATHNLVLRQCRSRYVLVLDEDTLVPKGTLAKMVDFMDAHPRVAIAGCRTLNTDGSYQRSFGLVPSLASELVNAFKPDAFWPGRLYKGSPSVQEVEWLNGSFMLVRREAIDEVGVLDEHYYTYGCEADWCHRMRRGGWKVVYVPDAEIVHIGRAHSRNYKLEATNHVDLIRSHVNRYYFFRKHHGRLAHFLLRPIMIAGSLLRLAFYAAMWVRRPDRRPVAAARIRTFVWVVGLSLSPDPDRLPARLARTPSPS